MAAFKLGLFGGSFNPPHVAHLIAAECAREELGLDQILFMPASIPPHKREVKLASGTDRLAMLELAIANNPAFAVSDIELHRDGPSYTIDTIEELQRLHSDAELYLLIGFDMLAIFPSWYKSQEILSKAKVIALARPPHSLTELPTLDSVNVSVLTITLLEISSTDIRAKVQAGKSVRYLVPEAVEKYIRDHELYRE